ncbi:Squalene--hopene cyclase [Anatilimnocola aggregata]|uniref:Squalene--hopene cyclase n=1 Tax=Anatilimnocola aggregata TaxID=2528021 RepID=A0A517YLK5_9BACT|nr:prenyltransferase/squalene oxidase repeat-containing protein [Anatilimnocola aggregata]QDU31090.1 Squalene--hopene cyclase [Anatilimnocola aggregata]
MNYDRLLAAYTRARNDLLAARGEHGHWEGRLASSSLSTATAVSALALVQKHGAQNLASELQPLIEAGVKYLAGQQNADGGFGDTDKSHSNIATTYLVIAAVHLAGREQELAPLLTRAQGYVAAQGGMAGLRKRYGIDKTFVVPIMTNLSLAGLCDWREISPLPFELACIPQSWYRFAQMPVVSYAIPALVAIGQAHYFHRKPWNPYSRFVRGAAVAPSMKVLLRMQPQSGGYLEATPLTSFVVMSLAATGRADHAVSQAGVRFLKDSMRDDGSWPIDTNLATWVTSLSLNALAAGGQELPDDERCWSWLRSCQHLQRHPFTGADPGGWGWTDLSGAVPDADDTPGALLALSLLFDGLNSDRQADISQAASMGIAWLLKLQNRDRGWPTFCRGWGKLPFDRSGTDLTAHAIRALNAWMPQVQLLAEVNPRSAALGRPEEIVAAIERGFHFLKLKQNPDGSWSPLWFGNQDHPEEDNPVYGTAKVLLAYRDLQRMTAEPATRGVNWLIEHQNADGTWGSSLEETALAVEALLASPRSAKLQSSVDRGLGWLVEQVEQNRHQNSSPIGFYFAKLWYYEQLYPLIFTVSTLGQALPAARPPE